MAARGSAASAEPSSSPSLRQLRRILFAASLTFLLVVEGVRLLIHPHLSTWRGHLMMDAVILAGVLIFVGAVFETVAHLHKRLERQRREIDALHRATLDLCGELSLESVLQKVVDQACHLLDARYGAIAILGADGGIREFVTCGITAEERAKIGAPPRGRGLLGVTLAEGKHLRLTDARHHPRSEGLPPHHPPIRSLLAVPIVSGGPFRGNLYLANKLTAADFSAQDEETLLRFAAKATIAIDNAHLHQRLRDMAVSEERLRIAREMHDGMAQVLAYVNTKAQAVREYMRSGKHEKATAQLEQLAAAARAVYTDAREGILALRTPVGPERSLTEALEGFMTQWQDQSGISGEVVADGDLPLTPAAELQLLRIVQESLSNVRKHSHASHARVELRRNGEHIRVVVEDDGAGFDLDSRSREGYPRFGLAIMRERAESVGGSLEIDSSADRGTRLTVRIPIGAETA